MNPARARRVRRAAALVPMMLASLSMAEPNRLARESSPYLLQHKDNPVDWFPWGDEAFAKAREEGKPIFLSIGYSTCHWCHVMERESFENAEIAALMNRDFVSIKVDREERPDVDNVYMTACQLLTRSGGWPLTVILTPEGRPFFAGTYFPPGDSRGRAGMRTLLPRIAEYWKSHRAEAEEQAKHVEAAVRSAIASPPKENAAPLDSAFAASVEDELARRFDPTHGGFSGAPKFPPHGALELLLSRGDGRATTMLRKTLDEMQDGGIFDHVGGGFHRYSVDDEWFVPHFEKMLYDNAQLLSIYAAAARRFGDERYADTARSIAAWLEREMRTPEGAYASALDADSEGVEGKYYLWTAAEVDAALGPEAPLWREAFGIGATGNLPAELEEGRGKNLPRRVESDSALAKKHGIAAAEVRRRLTADAERLEAVRARRVPPSRDDKVLTSWNALAVSALARASRDIGEPRFLGIARRIADFLLKVHVADGRVLHSSRHGNAKIAGFLDDDAFLAEALLDLSEVSGDPSDAKRAREIAEEMVRRFRDSKNGGFFQSEAPASGERDLLSLAKEYLDQVEPSPNAVAVRVLRRLDAIAPSPELRSAAEAALASAAPYARTFPTAATSFARLAAGVRAAPERRAASAARGPVRVAVERRPGEIAVRFSLEAGWHVQSRTPSRPELVPTRVVVRGAASVEPRFPEATSVVVAGDRLSVYSGEFTVTANAPGDAAADVDVEFQACDDSRCLAPVKLELEAPALPKEKR